MRRPSAARKVAPLLALVLTIAAIVAAAAAISGGDTQPQRAPWDSPDAPEVLPAPLIDQ